MWAKLWRFLRSVTLFAYVADALLWLGALACVAPLEQAVLRFIVRNEPVQFSSVADPFVQYVFILMAFATVQSCGWFVAAMRGYVRGEKSGVVRLLAYTAPVLAAAAVPALVRVLLLRAVVAEFPSQGGLRPMILVRELDWWRWSLVPPLFIATALTVWVRRPTSRGCS